MESGTMALSTFRVLPTNAKDHDIGLLAQSMERWGFLERVVVNRTTGHILSGHGRIETLRTLRADGGNPPEGIFDNTDQSLPTAPLDDWLVPVDYVDLSPMNERAAAIALNRAVEMGGWHEELLTGELKALAEREVSFEGIGYDLEDLDRMVADAAFRDAPPPESEPKPVEAAQTTDRATMRYGIVVIVHSAGAEDDLVTAIEDIDNDGDPYEIKRLSEAI